MTVDRAAMTAERTVVTLVRHGEVHNPDGILYGRLPGFPLSERGRRQAAAVAEHLRGVRPPVAAVVSSPLERALQTAAPIAEAAGVAVSVDERLIESGLTFQGRPLASRLSYARPADWRHLYNPWRPSWGEAYRDIAARMRAAIDDAREAHPGGRVVCVSHQSPIWVTRRAYEERRLWHDPRRRQCDHASLTQFTFDGGQLAGIGYQTPAADL